MYRNQVQEWSWEWGMDVMFCQGCDSRRRVRHRVSFSFGKEFHLPCRLHCILHYMIVSILWVTLKKRSPWGGDVWLFAVFACFYGFFGRLDECWVHYLPHFLAIELWAMMKEGLLAGLLYLYNLIRRCWRFRWREGSYYLKFRLNILLQ